uniref:GH18 domain-containing protein n=1 Tax=Arion vulgaris TaxID=1028688 RepID=A0A0B7BJT9_9EUPU
MRALQFETILTILAVGAELASSDFLRVCYFQSWARHRTNVAKYDVENIDPNLCTHLIYSFGKLDINTKQLTASEPAVEEGANGKFSQFNNLKSRNPALKTLISIGGQNETSDGFLAIASSDDIMNTFSSTTVQFLRSRGFDGIDIDWEYPNSGSKAIFTNILKSLNNAFNSDTTRPKLLLTIAGAAGKWNIDPGYDIPEIVKYIDYANLMTYDYTDSTAKLAAFNSPLYSRNNFRFDPTLSTNWTVQYWKSLGMPYSKIVVGVTGVGRRLVLQNVTNTVPGSDVTGDVRVGKYYGINAGLAYPEICEMLATPPARRTFDEEQKNPYLVSGADWVGYDDKQSIGIKLQWMTDLGVAGIMFWALDYDDFTGKFCNDGVYPLLNLIMTKTTTGTPSPSISSSALRSTSPPTAPPITNLPQAPTSTGGNNTISLHSTSTCFIILLTLCSVILFRFILKM